VETLEHFERGQAEVGGVHVALGNAVVHVAEHVNVADKVVHLDRVAQDDKELVDGVLDERGELGLGQVLLGHSVLEHGRKRTAQVLVVLEREFVQGHGRLDPDLFVLFRKQRTNDKPYLHKVVLVGRLKVLLEQEEEKGRGILAYGSDHRRAVAEDETAQLGRKDVALLEDWEGKLEDERLGRVEEAQEDLLRLVLVQQPREQLKHLGRLHRVLLLGVVRVQDGLEQVQDDQAHLRGEGALQTDLVSELEGGVLALAERVAHRR